MYPFNGRQKRVSTWRPTNQYATSVVGLAVPVDCADAMLLKRSYFKACVSPRAKPKPRTVSEERAGK